MPCYVIVQIEVKDEAAAKDALKALKLDPERFIRKSGNRTWVEGIPSNLEGSFRQQYGKAYSVREARRKFFVFGKEEILPDGSIRLTFEKE